MRCLVLTLLLLMAQSSAAAADPLEALGFNETQGAAAGYLDDSACQQCHADKAASFKQVGMSRSMRRPRADALIEDFDRNHFFHEPSQRHYEMHWDGETLYFERYQLDADGNRINAFRQPVDWILGSGNRARSYLYQTPNGELYQLPIGWYNQEGIWRMSPGFEHAEHQGVTRPVQRECLFCHNAFPDVPEGSDRRGEPHVFPEQLPEGIGCQRCHGPGAAHVRAVLGGTGLERIRQAIVNPARLSPERREEVCYQCHLLPSVSLVGVRRFDRPDYSFRPGQDLNEYLLHVEPEIADAPESGRFEINHHAYRLRQSQCREEDGQPLSCLSCHDPHRKIARPAARDHFRDACLECHQAHDSLPQEGRLTEDGEDCVACHMPQRRTADVVHVTMTDHRIAAGPFDHKQLLAPMEKVDPIIEGIDFYFPERSPDGALGQIYQAVTLLRAGHNNGAAQHLANQLGKIPVNSVLPFLDLARAQLEMQAFEPAIQTLEWVLARRPRSPRASDWLGLALLATGETQAAQTRLEAALKANPSNPETLHNLALAFKQQGRLQMALGLWERSIALRPNMAVAWYHKGHALALLERQEDAADALRRALAIDPTHSRAYAELVRTLKALGEEEQAKRVLRHARRHAAEPAHLDALD